MSPLIGIISFINAKLGHIDVLCSVQKSTQYYTAYDFYTKIHMHIWYMVNFDFNLTHVAALRFTFARKYEQILHTS